MSTKELDRARTIALIVDGRLTQAAAASRLRLTDRQVRRLVKAFERDGAPGLALGIPRFRALADERLRRHVRAEKNERAPPSTFQIPAGRLDSESDGWFSIGIRLDSLQHVSY